MARFPSVPSRPPTATEVAEVFGGGLLAAVGPAPVLGPWVVGPLVRDGEPWPPPHSLGFTWEFLWPWPNDRSVRIEMYPDPSHIEGVHIERLIRSYGHDGPAKPTTLLVPIDGVPFEFHGERVGDGLGVQGVVDGVGVELWFYYGEPVDGQLVLERRRGPDLDALLGPESMFPLDPLTGLRG